MKSSIIILQLPNALVLRADAIYFMYELIVDKSSLVVDILKYELHHLLSDLG